MFHTCSWINDSNVWKRLYMIQLFEFYTIICYSVNLQSHIHKQKKEMEVRMEQVPKSIQTRDSNIVLGME